MFIPRNFETRQLFQTIQLEDFFFTTNLVDPVEAKNKTMFMGLCTIEINIILYYCFTSKKLIFVQLGLGLS